MKRVTYSGKMEIGGSGIGSTAMHQVKPLYTNKMLGKIYAPNLKAPKDVSMLPLFHKQIPEVPHPLYLVGDILFDTITSLEMEEPTILQTWMNHSYAQMNRYPDAIKIINLFSAHPDVQARLVGMDVNEPATAISLKRQRAELEMADHILVPSSFALESLKEFGLDKKATVMPFGVDLEKFTPGDKKFSNLPLKVIFVGSNWERKGGPQLLKAWDKLDLKDAELTICGVQADALGDVGIKENVKVGWVPDLVEALQNSSLFILPALEDGCPLATHEAMACGLPAVVTHNTGTKDYITDGKDGWVIDSHSVDAICDVLQYAYDNTVVLSGMGQAARKTIEKWPWERYEQQYIDFIRGLE
jgi:glycosyltransferase involved in cell wall biosynthesis|tara:strand:+ start:2033 stop:3106 length:1074 start_codon:yes stop_codon:yes gene_type:complete